jgi:putative transcriptional regulator
MNKRDIFQEQRGDEGRVAVQSLDDDLDLAEDETDFAYLEAMTDEEALQNALNDPDAQPLTPEQLARMRRYPDPKRIRLGLDLTQEQFARRFEIALGTLRDWEQNVRLPDSAATAYLRVIANDPEAVERALANSYRRD